jgi:drug/metabolite transporter (DMT)-like permease
VKYVIKAILCISIFSSSTYTMQPLMNAIAPGLSQTVAIGVGCGFIVPCTGLVFSSTFSGKPKPEYIPSTFLGATAGGTLGVAFHLFFSLYSTGSVSSGTARFCTTVSGLLVGLATLMQSNKR